MSAIELSYDFEVVRTTERVHEIRDQLGGLLGYVVEIDEPEGEATYTGVNNARTVSGALTPMEAADALVDFGLGVALDAFCAANIAQA